MQCVGLPRQQIQTSLFIEFRRIQLFELSGQTLFTFRKRTSGHVLEYAPGIFKMGIPVILQAWKRIKQDSRAQRAKNREARRFFTITPERVTTCSSAAIVSDITTTPSTSTYLPSTSTPLLSTSTPLPSSTISSTPLLSLPSNSTPLPSTSTPLPSLPSTGTPLQYTSTPLPSLPTSRW